MFFIFIKIVDLKRFVLFVLFIAVACESTVADKKESIDPKEVIINNSSLYDILINRIYEDRNSRFCAACSGYYNLVDVSLYESNEDYKIVTKEENPYYLEDTSGYSNSFYLNKDYGNVIAKENGESHEKYTLIGTYQYKDIFIDLIFWASNIDKNNNGDLLKENGSTKEEEEIENINWSNLNLPAPLKSSIFVVEDFYWGEGFQEISGYDVISNKNGTYEYEDIGLYNFDYLNSNKGPENIDKILLELKNINSNQANEILQEINKLNKEDQESFNFMKGNVLGSYVSEVIQGMDENDLPKKIKIIYDSRPPKRYSKQKIYYAENASHNPYLAPVEQIINKNEADKLQRELGLPYIDSHTLILDGKPYYLYYNTFKNESASIRAYKYNDGKYAIFSGSGNIGLYRSIWNSMKPEDDQQLESNNSSTNLLSLSDAVSSMKKRAYTINQEIVSYFETEFEPGKKVYLFYLNSLSKPGYSCVTILTPYSDEPIGADCDVSSKKAIEWNAIPGSPKIYY